MSEILNAEELRDRARDLGSFNGLSLVHVDVSADGTSATVEAEFWNDNALADIAAQIAGGAVLTSLFRIEGGRRAVGGSDPGQVQVTAVSAGPGPAPGLTLTVAPVGDYSTYRLVVVHPLMDPVFAEIEFKFRPGCFNVNCSPRKVPEPLEAAPRIDYLARDYHTFKHLLLNAMADRVPGWQPTSEADLDQVIINLLAARGDELADHQDRVANEAFFMRARKRVSLARHARLMDYHIHQGNQASTWLALEVQGVFELPANFAAWTGSGEAHDGEIFVHDVLDLGAGEVRSLREAFNALSLYTWGGLVGALDKGATQADITAAGEAMTEAEANALNALIAELPSPMLIAETLNPETGRAPGRDPRMRQTLTVIGSEVREDPLAGAWMVRIRWSEDDALKDRYCFITRCAGEAPIRDVSLFHGNLVPSAHGQPNLTLFTDPDRVLDTALAADLAAERATFTTLSPWGRVSETTYTETPWGRLCVLPEAPLAYRDTPPGGETEPESTLVVSVEDAGIWGEQIDLTQSLDSANHFIVETSETGSSTLRFGQAPNGQTPPPGSFVAARYQTGIGTAGNVGANRIVTTDMSMFPQVLRVWNPFDVTNGRSRESSDVIRRRAPEAYRARQLRAVTLADYRKRAEELPFVQRAAAAYAWTGSWRTVRVTLDPRGTTELGEDQLDVAARYLNQVRLIGEDLEIRPPDFVPLDIRLIVCACPRYWPEDLRADLEDAFSEGYSETGETGFFHPDRWTFGQSIFASEIVGRALAVDGVDRVLEVGMRLWDHAGGPTTETITVDPNALPPAEQQCIDVADNQIIRVANDPNALELGRIEIQIRGGRR